jgi:hypothetical protein
VRRPDAEWVPLVRFKSANIFERTTVESWDCSSPNLVLDIRRCDDGERGRRVACAVSPPVRMGDVVKMMRVQCHVNVRDGRT